MAEAKGKQTVFVAGATGYVGEYVVGACLKESLSTFAHVRPDSASLEAWRKRFETKGASVDTSPWTQEGMTQAMKQIRPDIVFALLGTTRARMNAMVKKGQEKKDGSYMTVDYGLTAILIQACVAAEISPRFVYLSAVGATPGAKGEYYEARVRAEAELNESGLPFTIVRPSFITGPDRRENRLGERIGAGALDGLMSLVGMAGMGGLKKKYGSISGKSLAAQMVRFALEEGYANVVVDSQDLDK